MFITTKCITCGKKIVIYTDFHLREAKVEAECEECFNKPKKEEKKKNVHEKL